jgi:hypothetical protein
MPPTAAATAAVSFSSASSDDKDHVEFPVELVTFLKAISLPCPFWGTLLPPAPLSCPVSRYNPLVDYFVALFTVFGQKHAGGKLVFALGSISIIFCSSSNGRCSFCFR